MNYGKRYYVEWIWRWFWESRIREWSNISSDIEIVSASNTDMNKIMKNSKKKSERVSAEVNLTDTFEIDHHYFDSFVEIIYCIRLLGSITF